MNKKNCKNQIEDNKIREADEEITEMIEKEIETHTKNKENKKLQIENANKENENLKSEIENTKQEIENVKSKVSNSGNTIEKLKHKFDEQSKKSLLGMLNYAIQVNPKYRRYKKLFNQII